MTHKILSLDLSTTASGWAMFDLKKKKLLSYGVIIPRIKNPTKKGVPQYSYPEYQVLKIRDICQQILELITNDVKEIVIEEINRGKARIQQKILDGLHFVLLDKLTAETLKIVKFIDSDGFDGWRSKNGLGLQLSAQDKEYNKSVKKLNKKLARKDKKVVITQKHLCCNLVNKTFKLNFNVDENSTDADICDAIGLGWFYVSK